MPSPGRSPLIEDCESSWSVEVIIERFLKFLPAGMRTSAKIEAVHERISKCSELPSSVVHRLVGEVDRLRPVPSHEEEQQRLAPPAVERLANRDDVARGLRHLRAGEAEHPVVRPDARELVPERARLRQLVLVVREDEVEAAAVDLEGGPEELLGHNRALDVPARPATAPGRLPRRVLAGLVRLPEREVPRILLQRVRLLVLVHEAVRALVRELPVLGVT